jgi:thioesterase domain-containing protein
MPAPLHARTLAGLALLAALVSGGCTRNLGSIIRTGPHDPGERIVGLYPCGEGRPEVAELDPTRPLTVLVHGCTSSGARFRTLADVFEAHGQQTLCFNYNDRDFLNTSASQLALALGAIQRKWEPHEITLLGHSQGGLVARRALQSDLPRALVMQQGFGFRLVTVSSPFHGIASSSDCGRVWLHAVTLSATVAVCIAIAGNKWNEIPPGSRFMTNRAPLLEAVTRHLQIVTDERDTCRTVNDAGACEVDDFVFAREEQYSEVVSSDTRVTTVEIPVGHAAAVGENRVPPLQLIAVLQREGVLPPTPPEREAEMLAYLEELYR